MSVPKNQTASPTVRQQAEMSDAVRRARYELAAKNPTIVAKGKGAHVPAASVGQHFKVRARVTELLCGNPTPDGIVKLSGMPDAAALRAVADWSMPPSGIAPLRTLSREFTGDRWAQGRYLAGILSVWIDELRAEQPRGGARAHPAEPEHQVLGRYLSEAERATSLRRSERRRLASTFGLKCRRARSSLPMAGRATSIATGSVSGCTPTIPTAVRQCECGSRRPTRSRGSHTMSAAIVFTCAASWC
jgi:hypothetical protein